MDKGIFPLRKVDSTMTERLAELGLKVLRKDWIVDGRVVWATL